MICNGDAACCLYNRKEGGYKPTILCIWVLLEMGGIHPKSAPLNWKNDDDKPMGLKIGSPFLDLVHVL